MASETTTISLIEDIMKEVYEPAITNNIVEDSELFDLFTQDMNIEEDKTTGGKYIKTAQLFEPATGYGGRGEGGYIPEARAARYENALIKLKRIYGTVEMSGFVLDRVKTDESAFIEEADRVFPAMEESVRNTLDRMLHGAGGGIIARVNEATPDTTLPVDSMYGVTGLNSRPAILFQENEQIVFSANANGEPLRSAGTNQSAVITAIDVDNKILTIDGLPTGVADNDFIFLGDEADDGAPHTGDNKEVMGLLGHIDGGATPVLAVYFNITRANERLWNSFIKNAAGPFTEDIALEVDDEVAVRGGGKPTDILLSRKGLRGYFADLKSDRTFPLGPNDPRAYTGGKGPLSVVLGDRRVGLRATRKMPDEIGFLIDRQGFKRFHNVGWTWSRRTGAMWNQVVDSKGRKDAFYAWGYWELESANKTPAKCAKVTGIT